MSQVLEVSQTEIKEAVRRDRCDWLAAIYNLLIDQPEGRNVLQQMIAGDPNDQLVDAAHYQGSTEHLRLSQAGVLWREGERGGRKREVGERERGKRGREGGRSCICHFRYGSHFVIALSYSAMTVLLFLRLF